MKIEILYIHQGRKSPFEEEIGELLKRFKTPWSVVVTAIKSKCNDSFSVTERKERESKMLLEAAGKRAIWCLDSTGKELSSEQFYQQVQKHLDTGREIVFAIGGAVGFSNEFTNKASYSISLSKMTFTHEIARLLLVEQLYRGYTMSIGSKYHK